MKNFIKNFDFFGHNVTLHFGNWKQKKGPDISHSHKTIFGGAVSIFISFIIFVLTIYYLKKLYGREDNKNNFYETETDWH